MVIPLYNHASTVVEVIEGACRAGFPVIVVDDGSSDDGPDKVDRWFGQHPSAGRLVRLGRNAGKARALARGMAEAETTGCDFAITVDADGQHDVTLIPAFAESISRAGHRPILVLGDRGPIPHDYPIVRLLGRMLSGVAVRAACGCAIGDAACGMRAYDVRATKAIRCLSGRYAWEEEVIARLTWRGTAISELSIPVIYRDASVARSHYRFRRDWPEGICCLLAVVALRVIDPRTRWAPGGAPWRELAWPILAGGRLTGPLASIAAGISATAMALAGQVIPGLIPASITATILAFAALRTRTPVPPLAIAGVLGAAFPGFMLVSALPLGVLAAGVMIARMRSRKAVADGRG